MSEVGSKTSRETISNTQELEKVRQKVMKLFHTKLEQVGSALENNRGNETEKTRPRGVIVMALWEEDSTMLASKMAENSLSELLKQAKNSGIDLDVILIANNGGGANPELGDKMRVRLEKFTKDSFYSSTATETSRPDGELKATTPWNLELGLGDSKKEEIHGQNRVVVVNQPFDKLNKGKLRAIRDVSEALAREITEHGYAPDFIMGMDAESTLMYANSRLAGNEDNFPPLKAMWNNLHRGGKIGVGTKDRFAVMDPKTGKPLLDVPVGSSQKGYELTNTADNFITLPGGAMMVRPEYYIAGMSAIAENVPGMGVEDYMFTKLLREEMRETGRDFEEDAAKSIGVINHINGTPNDWRAAIKQMMRWKTHAQAADEIFPEEPYKMEAFTRYVWLVVTQRFRDASQRGPAHLRKLLQDILTIPHTLQFLLNNTPADIFKESPINWTSNSVSE